MVSNMENLFITNKDPTNSYDMRWVLPLRLPQCLFQLDDVYFVHLERIPYHMLSSYLYGISLIENYIDDLLHYLFFWAILMNKDTNSLLVYESC